MPAEVPISEKPEAVCSSENCLKPARMQCPICKKLGLNSYFCEQSCFKENWISHKTIHETNEKQHVYNQWPNYKFTGLLRPYEQTPRRLVPSHIKRPEYADHPEGVSILEEESKSGRVIETLTNEEILHSRKACKLARRVMDEVAKVIKPGITTDYIDQIVHEEALKRDCYPSPLNYYSFPKSCCTSVNEVICHGIPDGYVIKDGDIVNVDITLFHNGFHGDLNETFIIGKVDETCKKLVKVTHECLTKAIEIVRPGVHYKEIGEVIHRHAKSNGFSVVRSYTGHGCHKLFHCPPSVPHYSKNKAYGVMKQGHVFTIEPMINEGTYHDECWPDNWTVDGKRSAQFEQTLLVTDTGCDILTKRAKNGGQPYFMDTE